MLHLSTPNIFLVTVQVTAHVFILLNHHLSIIVELWTDARWGHVGVNIYQQMNTDIASFYFLASGMKNYNNASK